MASRVQPIEVVPDVYEGLERIRRSGLTNMLDLPRVIEVACELGAFAAASWVQCNPRVYGQGVFCGFAVAEDP